MLDSFSETTRNYVIRLTALGLAKSKSYRYKNISIYNKNNKIILKTNNDFVTFNLKPFDKMIMKASTAFCNACWDDMFN